MGLLRESIRPSSDLRNKYNEISTVLKTGDEACIMTVNGRGSDGNPFFPEKIADFIHGNMSSLYRFQEGKYFGHLFCFIWCFCHTDLLPSIWKSFSFYHIIFICQ